MEKIGSPVRAKDCIRYIVIVIRYIRLAKKIKRNMKQSLKIINEINRMSTRTFPIEYKNNFKKMIDTIKLAYFSGEII